MRHPIIIDGRNIYQPATMAEAGFIYRGIGRTTPVLDVDVAANGSIPQRQQPAKAKRTARPKAEAH